MAILIDLEFTGIDNSFIVDNEIVQVKILNTVTNKDVIKNFYSKKELGAYAQLSHKVNRYEEHPLFDKDNLISMLSDIDGSIDDDFYGFGVDQDRKMLAKYNISIDICDIRTHFQKTELAYKMATEGSNLEATYLIVMGEHPPIISHAGVEELYLIRDLFDKMEEFDGMEYMDVVPFGHTAGMPISDYVQLYRRQADGYRYNNYDSFASALDNAIEMLEYDDFDDDDE